jgi:hypothetical protein
MVSTVGMNQHRVIFKDGVDSGEGATVHCLGHGLDASRWGGPAGSLSTHLQPIDCDCGFDFDAEGFQRIVMSEPLGWKGWTRIAWARFDSEEQCQAAMGKLDGRELHPLAPPAPASPSAGDEPDEVAQRPLLGARFRLHCLGTKPVADARLQPR